MVPSAKIIISSPVIRVDKANSDINNKKFISLLYSTDWDCIYHENIDESHLNEYGLHINRTESINLAKNLISGIRKFRYDLDSKINKKNFSLSPSVRNSDQLELDSSFKSDLVSKLYVGQPDDDTLELRKLRIKNPNKIIIANLNVNSIRNKFEMLSLLFHGVIDILMICKTKIDYSFPTEQFISEGYSTIYRLDGGFILKI